MPPRKKSAGKSKSETVKETVLPENNTMDSLDVEAINNKAKSSKDGQQPSRKRKLVDVEDANKDASKEDSEPVAKQAKNISHGLSSLDFSSKAKTEDGRSWNLKIASWNVNGIRAWLKKNGLTYLDQEKPDVLCIQEIKCSKEKMPKETIVDGYNAFWCSSEKEGYSGVGIYTKTEPISIKYGLGISKHDNEGRVITAEFEKFYLVAAYVPNAGRGLDRLEYRTQEWDLDFRQYLKDLDAKKPVILCGDLNVAHLEIDLKNPKTNKRTAGFTNEERAEFSALLNEGFLDSFRTLYPDKEDAYTFWSNFSNARERNIGWRLDYFVLSERLKKDLCDSLMRKDVMGSDHCPIVLLLSI